MEYYPDSWESVTRNFSEVQIAERLLHLSKVPCLINSPFREDHKPSFSIYTCNNRVLYKDFATGEVGDLQTLLCMIFKDDIIDIINDIMNNKNFVIEKTDYTSRKPLKKAIIKTTKRNWFKFDDDFWGKYGITRDWLEFANVYPIKYCFINNKVYQADKFAYTYLEYKDGKETQKVYQPFNLNGFKWISNADGSVWSLWSQLPANGDMLIITSSLKDALTIWANTGIPSCSLQSESTMPKKQVIEQLKSRFNNIFVLFDNDYLAKENHGRIFGKKVAERFNLKQIEIPTNFSCKDPSDLRQDIGKERFNELIFNLVN